MRIAPWVALTALVACSGGGDEPAAPTTGEGTSGADAAKPSDDTGDAAEPPPRYVVSPSTLGGFGHETVTIEDAECAWPAAVSVWVREVEAVLVEVSNDGCTLRFDVQGGSGGEAELRITDAEGQEVARLAGADSLTYTGPVGGDLLARPACIGDSLGSAMVSWYLSYEAQVKDGMFAFFFRQAQAPCTHPLVRPVGVPFIVDLGSLDPETGLVPTETLLTDEMVEYWVGLKLPADLRLNLQTPVCNQSVPQMHDLTWPFEPVMYTDGEVSALYEKLFRFPEGIPDSPASIMDTIETAGPSFVIVSLGATAYALDHVHVSDETLEADFDTFLKKLVDMASKPVVLLATMPDTASLPARPFSYAERYWNLHVNDHLYAAADRANATLETPRFFVAPTGELFMGWLGNPSSLDIGGVTYPVQTDTNGWPKAMIADAEGRIEGLGMGRFQGFFSLDHVHLTATGHALVANVYIHALNQALGPASPNPRLTEDVPLVPIAEVLARDVGTESRLQAHAAELGLPNLATYLDPMPPAISTSERCAIESGPMAGAGQPGCPAAIEILIDGVPCGDTPLGWPASLTIRVFDEGGAGIEGAAVGVAGLPAEEHALRAELAGGVTDQNGQIALVLEATTLKDQKGGTLLVQSGAIRTTCVLP